MKIEKLLKKIKPYNLKLLKETIQDNDYEYLLNKLFDWQEEYDWINWEIFKEDWTYCSLCNEYGPAPYCMCYRER